MNSVDESATTFDREVQFEYSRNLPRILDSLKASLLISTYQAGKLAEIREYNLNDVRVTRKVYERMVGCFGR